MGVAVKILGEVRCQRPNGTSISLPGVGQRRLLAMLALTPTSTVRAEWLEEHLGLTRSGVRTAVSRLRERLPDDCLPSSASGLGYALRCSVDADEFERMAAARTDRSILERALALWDGPALGEFRDEPWALPTVARLDELQFTAFEDHSELLVREGRFGEAIARLNAHVTARPLRDRAWGLLMHALAGDGRQAEALRAYDTYRQYLAEETGLDPSPSVRAIGRDITVGRTAIGTDPALGVPASATSPRRPAGTAHVGNLPAGVATFIGREQEIADLQRAVGHGRVVTVTGPGGAGKTQLAIRVANSAQADFLDGVWWCDLTALSGAEMIPSVVASALGFFLEGNADPLAALVEGLRGRGLLLVFDNCEHVLDGAAKVLAAITQGCPTVAVLATSRAPVGVDREQVWPISPLDPEHEGVRLLLARARAGSSDLDTASWDPLTLKVLCERLDGLPLAIEMAGARLRTLTPQQLIDRLDHRFTLLESPRRDATARHRTLTALLDWSHELLEPTSRSLADRLSVFAAAFDLEAVEAICTGDGVAVSDVAPTLAALVERSIVATTNAAGSARFRLLETVRDYGRTHLEQRGELVTWRRRHAVHFAAEARDAGMMLYDQRYWIGQQRMDANWGNITSALEWSIGAGQTSIVRDLLRGCLAPATSRGRSEIGELAAQALELPEPPAIAYGLAAFYADGVEQITLCEIGLRQADVDAQDRACLYSQLAGGRASTGARGTIAAILGASEAARDWGRDTQIAYWEAIAAEALAVHDSARAATHAEHAEALVEEWIDYPEISAALGRLASYEARLGNLDRAVELADITLPLAERGGMKVYRDQALSVRARVAAVRGASDANSLLAAALRSAYDTRWWFTIWPLVSDIGRWFENTGLAEAADVVTKHFEAHGRPRLLDLLPSRATEPRQPASALRPQRTPAALVEYVLRQLDAATISVTPTN